MADVGKKRNPCESLVSAISMYRPLLGNCLRTVAAIQFCDAGSEIRTSILRKVR